MEYLGGDFAAGLREEVAGDKVVTRKRFLAVGNTVQQCLGPVDEFALTIQTLSQTNLLQKQSATVPCDPSLHGGTVINHPTSLSTNLPTWALMSTTGIMSALEPFYGHTNKSPR